MTEFFLTVYICSMIAGSCSSPMHIGKYDTFYKCALSGYKFSQNVYEKQGAEMVNYYQTLINFTCLEEKKKDDKTNKKKDV